MSDQKKEPTREHREKAALYYYPAWQPDSIVGKFVAGELEPDTWRPELFILSQAICDAEQRGERRGRQGAWIPCSERMPEVFDYVDLSMSLPDTPRFGQWRGADWRFFTADGEFAVSNLHVTHWRERPKPPVERSEHTGGES